MISLHSVNRTPFKLYDPRWHCPVWTEFHPNTLTHDDTAQCELSFIQTFRTMMTLSSVNWVSSKNFIHDGMASVNWVSSKHIWPMMGWWHFVCIFNGPCELNFIQTHWPIMTLHVLQWAAWTEFHPNTFIHGIACDSKWAVWTKVHNCHKILKCAFIPFFFWGFFFFLEIFYAKVWKLSCIHNMGELWSTWTT
jgi:hypothetical protein